MKNCERNSKKSGVIYKYLIGVCRSLRSNFICNILHLHRILWKWKNVL